MTRAAKVLVLEPLDLSDRDQLGANLPPAEPKPDPRAAHVLNIEGYLLESANWLDGSKIENEGQAEAVKKLRDSLQEAADAADEQRKVEKEPHDDAITEIQGFWNPFIAPLTNKKPGTVSLAIKACSNALTTWLLAEDAKKEAAAKIARDAADAASKVARDALAAASVSSDLGAREEAEQQVVVAQQAERAATQVERSKPSVTGFGRAASLRDNWVCAVADETAALRHYWDRNRPALVAAALEIAKAEVRAGVRTIPGFTITNERRL